MTDAEAPVEPQPDAPETASDEFEEPNTTGTMFIMMVFLMALAALWAIMYFLLLER
jgi:hypothetical protein